MSERPGLKQRCLAAVEAVWALVFRVVGRARRSTVRSWESPGDQPIMVVAPHPDDEVLGYGGTLLRHRRRGDRVAIVCVTDGQGPSGARPDPEACSRYWQEEMERSADMFGVERLDWIGLPEWRWELGDLPALLDPLLTAWSPNVLHLPSRVDDHPEHRKEAHGVALSLPDGDGPSVRVCRVQVPLTSVLVNLISDTPRVAGALQRSLSACASQRRTARSCLGLQRYAAEYNHRQRSVEEFWEMTPVDCHAIHCSPPERWFATTFRGLRQSPPLRPSRPPGGSPCAPGPGRSELRSRVRGTVKSAVNMCV